MKTLIKITFLLLLIFLLSCERDYPFTPLTDGVLLKEISIGGHLSYVYTYNDANQILENKNKWFYIKYNYRNNRLVSSDIYVDSRILSSSGYVLDEAMKRTEWVSPENTAKETTFEYFYTNNKLVTSTLTHGFYTYNYDADNRIIRQTFYEEEGKESGYTVFSYDAKGNMNSKLTYDNKNTLETSTVYEFDDKNNPYRAFSSLIIPGENTNPNNIIKETYTIHFQVDDFIKKVQIRENSYEYNGKGYPISKNNNEVRYTYY